VQRGEGIIDIILTKSLTLKSNVSNIFTIFFMLVSKLIHGMHCKLYRELEVEVSMPVYEDI